MRHDMQFLEDIAESCGKIEFFIEGRTANDLRADLLLQSAVLYQLSVIGEAASKVSVSIRDKYPEVPWRQISAMRNYVIHAYFSLDLDIVWQTAIADVPKLRKQIVEISLRE